VATKKEALKAIIRALHGGLGAAEARDRVVREVGAIETAELVRIEQELIDEGLPVEEVTRFCNVHVLLVQDSLHAEGDTTGSARPVSVLMRENVEIRRLVQGLRSVAAGATLDQARVAEALARLAGLDRHYALKENLLFPYLEKHGFPGPSKVMWQKDNEVRALHKSAVRRLDDVAAGRCTREDYLVALEPFMDEAEGMVDKEEQILLPAATERLGASEWAQIGIEMDEMGYAFIEGGGSPASGVPPAGVAPTAQVSGGSVTLPSGILGASELQALLNTLPLEITFVDADDRVRYFNEGKDRIFVRTRAVIGRPVVNCHPPKSLAAVEKIVEDLRSGRADHHDFWIDRDGRKILIRYFAVRDPAGKYLGTLEVTQDITAARALQGEKRLASAASPISG
jgi:hypothetical protein